MERPPWSGSGSLPDVGRWWPRCWSQSAAKKNKGSSNWRVLSGHALASFCRSSASQSYTGAISVAI